MEDKFSDLVEDPILEEELIDLRGGTVGTDSKYGCKSAVCANNSDSAKYCTHAVCETGA